MSNTVTALPFVAFRQDGTIESHWNPERTGDYAVDCATGRNYAGQFAAMMRDGGNESLLPWIIRAMPRGQEMSGVEIGFLTALSMLVR
ncbi:hypothetical protein OLX02_01620 [Novosphingobium sp. KCTC 2891]|uniref:hypothetical protein n=1 Tax=Novosphingobium sp. KCTC 2891 TaxID=2989730 RepID=UPI002222A852|nr:hypothetical protein [Novosphingobium sp. KCTC 2891]MCW1381513.1 hypothetical protein [Novosphingobium sp. KCTC 2891]